jgi:putative glutamine amidotransferase
MPYLVLGDKYARALRRCANAQALLLPLADPLEVPHWLQMVDGVMLTGSPSNVHPSHFGETVADTSLPLDQERDALTLALVRACVEQAVPLLGICRGFQEMNVALGGSLLQQVHLTPGKNDHRDPAHEPAEVQYAPSHEVQLTPGSLLAELAGGLRVKVNSLHGQGVGRLAEGLQAIAHADDGLVEAFEVKDAPGFTLGVQWHPEWRCHENPFYTAIFQAFSLAMQQRRQQR